MILAPLLLALASAGLAPAGPLPAALAAGGEDPALARAPGAPNPPLHVSTFSSMRAARVEQDGRIDAGDCVLQLVDAATGEPWKATTPEYGPKPDAWVGWVAPAGALEADVRVLAVPVTRGGDERCKAIVRVFVPNRSKGGENAKFTIAASLRAGGGDAAGRPFPSAAFDAAATYKQEGQFITRDGRAVFLWAGTDAKITLNEHVAAAGDEIAHFSWDCEVPPGNARLLELSLVGPPALATVDEAAVRDGLEHVTFQISDEQVGWQTDRRGSFADIVFHDTRLWFALVTPLEYLRSLGVADRAAREFSDRPFGHPATDAAVDAEMLGLFEEWGFELWQSELLDRVVNEAVARGEGLPPARRVALVHGLARAVRLNDSTTHRDLLATAIRTLLDKSTEGAEVRSWLDPELVRNDLQGILDQASPGGEYALPHFQWGAAPAGSVAAELQAIRRAVSAHDAETVWAHMAPLIANTSADVLGAMQPGAVPDAEYQMAFASLMRDMIFDDHGEDLHLFAAVPREMIPPTGVFEVPRLPTRYGRFELQQFFSGKKAYGVRAIRHTDRGGRNVYMHLVPGIEAEALVSPLGGIPTLQEDGLIHCVFEPLQMAPKGLRFNVKLAKGAGR